MVSLPAAFPSLPCVASLPMGEQPVLVELNGNAILAREFENTRISEGDTVEVIRMVAGG